MEREQKTLQEKKPKVIGQGAFADHKKEESGQKVDDGEQDIKTGFEEESKNL